MRCETTSNVKECALRARSTHGVHHAIVEVSIVIGVVLGELLVARVVPLVVDAVIGFTLGLIAHVVIVVFVVTILHRIFLYGRYILYTSPTPPLVCMIVVCSEPEAVGNRTMSGGAVVLQRAMRGAVVVSVGGDVEMQGSVGSDVCDGTG